MGSTKDAPIELTGASHDLGMGFSYTYFSWDPDRALNPQYGGIPSVERAGIILWHSGEVVGAVWFDLPEVRAIPGEKKMWLVVSFDPLHLEPSIQTYKIEARKNGQLVPEHHGFIRRGRWESTATISSDRFEEAGQRTTHPGSSVSPA